MDALSRTLLGSETRRNIMALAPRFGRLANPYNTFGNLLK